MIICINENNVRNNNSEDNNINNDIQWIKWCNNNVILIMWMKVM